MRFGDAISFRKEIFFDGAVQMDWFYNQERAKTVAENFVFHGSEYFGASESSGRKLTDTVRFVHDVAVKISDDQRVNPLTLAVAGYGTGKSHLAVTLAELLSGKEYQPEVYRAIIHNIAGIDKEKAQIIEEATARPNLVLVLNGMKDFNLNYELLKAAQKSLHAYGCSDENLKKLNRALETAFRFFERNAVSSLSLFEEKARAFGYSENGEELIAKLRSQLGDEDAAFDVINAVYNEINGNEIRWDEGVSATAVLETLLSEYCGISGPFNKIIILFDEFGRYLEYASSTTTARSGDSALQQIFECAQNAEGEIQVINYIQSDIKTYLQRVDQTSNISRYIGRYDAGDKYYLSSNLETVFANLIQRTDKELFDSTIKTWQKSCEDLWNSIFESLNRWLPTKGLWRDRTLFRRVIVEGIYPLHPISTYMLSQLSDYLQNRSSLMLLGKYVNDLADAELRPEDVPLVYPESLLAGDLFAEMLAAEEEGRQYSQHCIRFSNILRKFSDKLSENSVKVLRANLAMRILRCRNESYEDVKDALSIFSGLDIRTVEEELVWLENEYAVLGYDDHSCCLDFFEDSSGAHDFRTYFKRLRANTSFSNSVFEDKKIRELAEVTANQPTNFAFTKKIKTNEWQFEQEMFPITDLSEAYIESCLSTWKQTISADKPKGKLIWLYINRDSDSQALENAVSLARKTANTPIVMMLLNDTENKLNGALCDYLAVQKMSESDRIKYGRHYEDKLQQTEENIRNAFDILRKQRICVTPDGMIQLNERLAAALTGVFERVYPDAVPFDFDGFDSKQPAKARKAFCSITRLLLSGAISDDTVHSFPADVRNRLEATLFASSAYSWKIINSNYQIVPPENKAVREVYNKIVDSVPEGGEISLDELLNKLMAPPYGMNDYVSVYMVTTVCANLSYCLRAVLNGELYSITAWKDKVIQDNKVDLPMIRKSILKRVNAGAVADRFLRLFTQIENNTDIDKVHELNVALVNLKQAEDVPEGLAALHQLALNKLQEGARVRKNWRSVSEEVSSRYDKLLETRDIYSGLLAIQKIRGTSFPDCFRDSSYNMSEAQKTEITTLDNRLVGLIQPFINGWINEQQCKGVENISQYRKHMERIQNLLSELGYTSEASEAKRRAEKELGNVENIKARQELRANYRAFMDECVVKQVVPYTRLLDWQKKGNTLIGQIEKFANTLGSDAERFKKNAQQRVQSISDAIDKIKNDMNDIYGDLDNVSSVEDIEDMIQRIRPVCQKGIPTADLNDFTELQKTLEAVQQDLHDLTDCKNDRDEAQKRYQELHNKYSEQDLDFDVVGILEQVNVGVVAAMDAKDQAWRSRYLTNQSDERSALLQWADNTRTVPRYLSDATKEECLKRKMFVEEQLSKARIGDVVFSFEKLNSEEQKECLGQLARIYSKGVEIPS